MANVKENLLYTATHEWVDINGNVAKVGLSDFRQDNLGEIVFVNFPAIGTVVKAGEKLAEVESLKAVSEVISPVSGKVVAINDELDARPNAINDDAYSAWLCKIEFTDKGEMLNAKAYAEICE